MQQVNQVLWRYGPRATMERVNGNMTPTAYGSYSLTSGREMNNLLVLASA